MGIVMSQRIDNALYGSKTDLISKLRDNEVPNWIHPRRHANDRTAAEILAAERDRAVGRELGGIASFRVFGTTPSANVSRPTDRYARPPEPIRKRLESYLQSSTHKQELQYLRPGEFFGGLVLDVTFGPRGGISDVYVEALYRD